ncbi:MAG: internal scaffolding protein [Arizlama microvirus]|nr:MAG: internal scaffolding protein [Arizlama microvirus]
METVVQDYFNRKRPKGITFTKGSSQTQQHFSNEVNINQIMDRYKKTGYLINPNTKLHRQAMQGDFTSVDFRLAQDAIIAAKLAFNAFPAKTRKQFNNDPAEMLAFAENPENFEACVKLGIFELNQEKKRHVQQNQPVIPETTKSTEGNQKA